MGIAAEGPTTRYFAGLLDELRRAGPDLRPGLINTLVGAAYARVRRLTQAIIRGEMNLPHAVETDDILQDSMADFARAVQEGLDRPFPTPDAMFGFLCRIVRRRAIDDVRKKLGPEFRAQFPGGIPAGAEPCRLDPRLERVVLQLTVNELVAELGEADQRFLNLLYIEGWTYQELAADVGGSAEAVRWREAKLLRALGRQAEAKRGRNPPPGPPPAPDPGL